MAQVDEIAGFDGAAISDVSLHRTTISVQIADILRERIIRGDLKPGTPLTEARFAKAFQVSRNTVREALALLTRDGIATQSAHRGVSVSVMTEDDVREIFEVRRLCELSAIDAARSAAVDEFQALEEAVQALRQLPTDADWRDIVDTDLNFHRTLVKIMGNSRLQAMFESLLTELRLCILIANVDDHQNPQSLADQHGHLFALLKSHETDQCKSELARHLADAEKSLLTRFAVGTVRSS